ncbi:MAG: hypothetical protein LBB88_08890 [Planctomycetaceae bacterium]|jgi:hypothetical protein|nr:hypothetical protein [Planctomycetaceae bacterium]
MQNLNCNFFDFRDKSLSSCFSCEFYYENDIEKLRTIIDTLETMNYFRGAISDVIQCHKYNSFIANSPINNIFCSKNERIRTINLDAEEIFEEGCLRSINDFISLPLFNERSRRMSISNWTDSELAYHVLIDDSDYCLWQYKKTDHTSEDWYIAFARTIMLMNDILIKNGYCDQIYFEYGDNDSTAVILTKEMFQYLAESNIIGNRIVTFQ